MVFGKLKKSFLVQDTKIPKSVRLNVLKYSDDYWMKTLQTIYPYGPNERARKHDSEVAVGKLFFSIPRTMQLSAIFEK